MQRQNELAISADTLAPSEWRLDDRDAAELERYELNLGQFPQSGLTTPPQTGVSLEGLRKGLDALSETLNADVHTVGVFASLANSFEPAALAQIDSESRTLIQEEEFIVKGMYTRTDTFFCMKLPLWSFLRKSIPFDYRMMDWS